ncbi:hypothetical protein [Paenibacillus cremeus]|nr:hypothetical protein [Paenibacillus cremeus]
MDKQKANAKNSSYFRNNKFTEEEAFMSAAKAAKRPPSLNGEPKETNPQ